MIDEAKQASSRRTITVQHAQRPETRTGLANSDPVAAVDSDSDRRGGPPWACSSSSRPRRRRRAWAGSGRPSSRGRRARGPSRSPSRPPAATTDPAREIESEPASSKAEGDVKTQGTLPQSGRRRRATVRAREGERPHGAALWRLNTELGRELGQSRSAIQGRKSHPESRPPEPHPGLDIVDVGVRQRPRRVPVRVPPLLAGRPAPGPRPGAGVEDRVVDAAHVDAEVGEPGARGARRRVRVPPAVAPAVRVARRRRLPLLVPVVLSARRRRPAGSARARARAPCQQTTARQ